jgi:hypothetical protein
LPGVFNLLISLAAVFAVLMIVIGGFQYMSTDAIQGKSAGRERIKNAIFGLILVLGAYLILYTINPKLLELNLSVDSVTVAQEGTEGGGVVDQSKLSCADCVSVGSDIAVKIGAGAQLDSSIMNSVTGLNNGLKGQGVGWKITEGYPPTVDHRSTCHNNGTCFDAGLTNPTIENVKRFVETARNNGLNPTYEITDQSQVANITKALSDAGLANPPVVYNQEATGQHFHVTK